MTGNVFPPLAPPPCPPTLRAARDCPRWALPPPAARALPQLGRARSRCLAHGPLSTRPVCRLPAVAPQCPGFSLTGPPATPCPVPVGPPRPAVDPLRPPFPTFPAPAGRPRLPPVGLLPPPEDRALPSSAAAAAAVVPWPCLPCLPPVVQNAPRCPAVSRPPGTCPALPRGDLTLPRPRRGHPSSPACPPLVASTSWRPRPWHPAPGPPTTLTCLVWYPA